MFLSRSSFEKPRSRVSDWRTTSPSRRSILRPRLSFSSASRSLAMVVLPAPESPVIHRVKPCRSFNVGEYLSLQCQYGTCAKPAQMYDSCGPSACSHQNTAHCCQCEWCEINNYAIIQPLCLCQVNCNLLDQQDRRAAHQTLLPARAGRGL